MNKIPNILFVARDDGGCGFYRCEQTAAFLKRSGLADAESVLQKPTPEQLMRADLVIMQHMGSIDASNIAAFCIQHNIPYMTEFDDFIHHVSPRNDGGYLTWNPGTLHTHRSMEMTKRAFGVTVSTEQLAREYFPYNPNVFIVPNYLDKDLWENPVTKRNDGKIRIGWAGGNAHADDLKMISGVIRKITREFKGKVIFETMGMTRQELHGVFPMEDFGTTCPHCGFEGEIHHWPGEGLKEYPMVLAGKGWDIALAPVIANSFGIAKSDIKVKEYSAAGISIVASPIPPYLDAVKSNAQVRFAASFEEWYDNIKYLIAHPEERDATVRHNKEWMEGNWIQNRVNDIFRIYAANIARAESIFGKKEKRK